MQHVAQAKGVQMSPRKVALVADAIRNKSIYDALRILPLVPKRASLVLEKTLKSAVANAVNNNKAQEENLIITQITVGGGVAMKRFRPSTRGRVHPYKKRTSNIRIVLEEKGDDKGKETINK
jgi:large subunit ribosomal protein L22